MNQNKRNQRTVFLNFNWVLNLDFHNFHHHYVLDMTLNCIHIFIVTGSIFSLFVLICHEAGQSAFLHTQWYLSIRIVIISYLACARAPVMMMSEKMDISKLLLKRAVTKRIADLIVECNDTFTIRYAA